MEGANKKWTLEDYERHMSWVRENSAVPVDDTRDTQAARKKRAQADYAYFFETYLSAYATSKCAWFHVWVAQMLILFPRINLLLGWFRGSAKSTHVCLGYPLWLWTQGELKCMLLVGQNKDKAVKLLSDIQGQFEANQLLVHDYGPQQLSGSWEEGEFVTRNGVAFFCIGFGQSPRGVRHENHRPDYIAVDDVDTDEQARNPKRVKDGVSYVQDSVMKTGDIGRRRVMVVNNMPFPLSIIGGLKDEFTKGGEEIDPRTLGVRIPAPEGVYYKRKGRSHFLRVNGVDNATDFNPTWPEKYDAQHWRDEFEESSRSFHREIQNTPVVEGTVFKEEWVRWETALALDEYESLVVYWDQSYKSGSSSDHKAIVLIGRKGRDFHLIKVFNRQCTISAAVKYLYDLYEATDYSRKRRPFNLKLSQKVYVDFWMEAVPIMEPFWDEIQCEGDARGYQLPMRADHTDKGDKFARIETMSPLFERGFFVFNSDEKENPDMIRAMEHLLGFEHGSRLPDDFPDALQGGSHISKTVGSLRSSSMVIGERPSKKW